MLYLPQYFYPQVAFNFQIFIKFQQTNLKQTKGAYFFFKNRPKANRKQYSAIQNGVIFQLSCGLYFQFLLIVFIFIRFYELACRLIIFLVIQLITIKKQIISFMTEYERRIDQFRTTILTIQNHSHDPSKIRFISSAKWKKLMIVALEDVAEYNYADKDLIHDLGVIIKNISEDKFIQAIMSFQPLKPKFKSIKFLDNDSCNNRFLSTASGSECFYQGSKTKLKKDSSIIQKGSIILQKKSVKKQPKTCETIKFVEFNQKTNHNNSSFLKDYLEVFIQEDILKKQFQKKYHPFRKIIEGFIFILENKYKNLIDQVRKLKIQKLQQLISFDILVLQKLFTLISQPYQTVYSSQNPEEIKSFKKKIQIFMKDYIHEHEKINSAVRKLMRHYSRKNQRIVKIQKNIPDFVEIANFNIPNDFKIDGCYVQSMNALMEFSETQSPADTLDKLKQFRAAIAKDVDAYYESFGQNKQRQISAEVQIQIIRFTICKLKGWVPQIFAQLKFLQVIYGDQDIAFKYDDASYIYAGLITVFDVLDVQSDQEPSVCSESKRKKSELN